MRLVTWQVCTAPFSRERGSLLTLPPVWTVTSAKPGNGVDMLRDNSNDTFWQCVAGVSRAEGRGLKLSFTLAQVRRHAATPH